MALTAFTGELQSKPGAVRRELALVAQKTASTLRILEEQAAKEHNRLWSTAAAAAFNQISGGRPVIPAYVMPRLVAKSLISDIANNIPEVRASYERAAAYGSEARGYERQAKGHDIIAATQTFAARLGIKF